VGIVDVEGHFAQQEAVRIVVVERLPSNSATTPITTTTPLAHTSPASSIPARIPHLDRTQSHSSSHVTHITHPPLFDLHHPANIEVGRAVVNYSATEVRRIKGLHSTQIHDVLGYADSEYIALRENIALMGAEKSRPSTPSFGHRTTSEHGDAH
jgi:glutamate 5-kinase